MDHEQKNSTSSWVIFVCRPRLPQGTALTLETTPPIHKTPSASHAAMTGFSSHFPRVISRALQVAAFLKALLKTYQSMGSTFGVQFNPAADTVGRL